MNEIIPVSIIIPSFRGGEKIVRCLESVIELDYPEYEIIVVDNCSNDGSLEKIREILNIKFAEAIPYTIIENKENLGVAKATNQGFKVAKYHLVLTLDEDVILHKDCLTELVKVISEDEKICLVVPKIFNYTSKKFQGIGFTMSSVIMQTKVILEDEDKRREIDYVPGAVVLSRNVGQMDEDYFLYYSDAQYSLDFRNEGYKIVYTPTALAWHDCNTAEGFTPFRIQQFIRSKLLFAQKNGKHLFEFYAYFFFVYAPARIVKYLIKGKFKMIPAFLIGIWEGCK